MEACLATIQVPTLVVWGDECVNVMDMFGFEVGKRKHEVAEILQKAEQVLLDTVCIVGCHVT